VYLLREAPAANVYIETRCETDGVSWPDVRRMYVVHFSVSRRAEVVVRYSPVGGTQGEVVILSLMAGVEEKFISRKTDFFGVSVGILFPIHGKFRSLQLMSTSSKFRRDLTVHFEWWKNFWICCARNVRKFC